MQTPYEFFYAHAGYSYSPNVETPEDGRKRCARAMAEAERRGSDVGLSFEWEIDPYASSADWIENGEDGGADCDPWQVWNCICRGPGGEALASLCGIDFGRDGEPWGDPHRRVVEAELASEALDRLPA